jgi:signal peptidase I
MSSNNSSKQRLKRRPKKTKGGFDEAVLTLFYALLLAMVFRSLLFQPFHIPSGSMKDTLLVGDYLFVSKFSYGYSRFSFPYSLPLFEGRIGFDSRPERGDVIVFRPEPSPEVDFIKRVVGLPNDTVQMIEGRLHINNLPVTLERIDDFQDRADDGSSRSVRRYEETLPSSDGGENIKHHVLDVNQMGLYDNTYPVTIPDGHYFVMGDNRDESADSRTEVVELVPEENIVGKAEIVVFSVDDRTSIWKIWNWWWALRLDRFFIRL